MKLAKLPGMGLNLDARVVATQICFGVESTDGKARKLTAAEKGGGEMWIGENLRTIQVLQNNESTKTTENYMHIVGLNHSKVKNSLDIVLNRVNLTSENKTDISSP